MPYFRYVGPYDRVYPEIMGPEGSLLASPGDVREMDEAPGDGYWIEETTAPSEVKVSKAAKASEAAVATDEVKEA